MTFVSPGNLKASPGNVRRYSCSSWQKSSGCVAPKASSMQSRVGGLSGALKMRFLETQFVILKRTIHSNMENWQIFQ